MEEISSFANSTYSFDYYHYWKGITTEDLLFAYICTLLSATFTIGVGSFVSLSQAVAEISNEKRAPTHVVKVKVNY